jgi:predicted TIM-barrel fold metal-dependent hydrolase
MYRNDADKRGWRGQPKTVLEPDLPIIDPHHHFWDTHRGRYVLPELLADIGGGHRVVATVFLNASYVSQARAAGDSAVGGSGRQRHCGHGASGITGRAAWPGRSSAANLTLGARARCASTNGRRRWAFPRHPLFVSWDGSAAVGKYISRVVPPHLVRDATFREGFAQLARLGLSFESWQYHPQLPDAIDLARAFPDTTMILNHVGGVLGVGPYARKRAEILAGWKKDMFELAKCPNVHVKLGGLGMTSFGFDFHERDGPPSSEELAAAWRQYVEPCIEGFGPERCMFESNFPPDKQSCGYTELWNAFKRLTAGASAAEKQALYSGTAARVYRLTVP